jgi:hypothetical protein
VWQLKHVGSWKRIRMLRKITREAYVGYSGMPLNAEGAKLLSMG